VTGTVVMGTSMARQSCRNTTITISTRIAAWNSVRAEWGCPTPVHRCDDSEPCQSPLVLQPRQRYNYPGWQTQNGGGASSL
jgi:hypothetical protein